jgi:hypothetical protein
MNENSFALVSATIVLLVGIALTILFFHLKITDGPSATIIALLLIPLVVYGIASGKILELSAPGGWSAKFQQAAKQKAVTTASAITANMKELQPVKKESLGRLRQIIPTLAKGKPLALILFFGRHDYQDLYVVGDYLQALQTVDPTAVVVMIDNTSESFVCMIEGEMFLELLDSEGQTLIDAINNGDINYLRRINSQRQDTVVVFRALTMKNTNADALRQMKELNIKTMIVVDENSKPNSIVKRDEIVEHIFEELTA